MPTRGINPESPAVSAAEVQKALSGMSYPASRDDLVARAQENNAPSEVVNTIRQLPGDQYGGPQDVMKDFGQVK